MSARTPRRWQFHRLLRLFVVPLLRCLFRFRVRGARHVPTRGPVLLVSNHPTYLDPIFINAALARPVFFIAWDALFRVPVLGWLVRAFGTVPVSLERGSIGSWRGVVAVLERGDAAGIFPEGGRTIPGQREDDGATRVMNAWKPGAAHLSRRTGAAIVPVSVLGAARVWGIGQTLPRPGRVTVRFFPPLSQPSSHGKGRDKDEERVLTDAIHGPIRRALARRRRAVRKLFGGRARVRREKTREAAIEVAR